MTCSACSCEQGRHSEACSQIPVCFKQVRPHCTPGWWLLTPGVGASDEQHPEGSHQSRAGCSPCRGLGSGPTTPPSQPRVLHREGQYWALRCRCAPCSRGHFCRGEIR